MPTPTRRIGPGLYLTGETLEIDVPELLAHLGWADTPENRDAATAAAADLLAERYPAARHVIIIAAAEPTLH